MYNLIDSHKYVEVNTPKELLNSGEVSFIKTPSDHMVQIHWRDEDGTYHDPQPFVPSKPEEVAPKKRGRPKGSKNKVRPDLTSAVLDMEVFDEFDS